MKNFLLAIAFVASFLSSCGDDKITLDPDAIGTAFYPLELGTFKIYNVQEIKYANNKVQETTTFQKRDVVNQIYKDQAGNDWFRVEISRRESALGEWKVIGVKNISRSFIDQKVGTLLVKENNRTIINMVYPVMEGKSWNPNAFNSNSSADNFSDQDTFQYEKVNQEFSANGKSYANTVSILKKFIFAGVGLDEETEVLALNEGTVYSRYRKFTYCDGAAGTNCEVGNDFIVSGTERIETLESAGKLN